jgi:small-conductance mechanosensitive channel
MPGPFAAMTETGEVFLRQLLAQVPSFAAGLVVFILFLLLARIVRRLVRGGLRRADRTLAQMAGTLAHGATIVAGVLVGLWVAVPTVNFAEVGASLGLTGLILGFALRDLLENFVAGLLILWRHPFRVGAQIRAGEHEGTVQEINFRSTVLRTYDGRTVFIPNGRVFTAPLENLTAYGERRSEVVLGIGQGDSVATARTVILRALEDMEGVLPAPAPLVLFDHVGDYTNDLRVLYWTRPPTRLAERVTRSVVTERLFSALQEAGIDFPYPIRTVRLADGACEARSGPGRGSPTRGPYGGTSTATGADGSSVAARSE